MQLHVCRIDLHSSSVDDDSRCVANSNKNGENLPPKTPRKWRRIHVPAGLVLRFPGREGHIGNLHCLSFWHTGVHTFACPSEVVVWGFYIWSGATFVASLGNRVDLAGHLLTRIVPTVHRANAPRSADG